MNESIEQEIKEMREELEEIKEMMVENSKMIKRLHNAYRISYSVSIIKWVIIIGFTLGTFYYIQPYLVNILKLYGSINSLTGGVENNGGIDILNALKKF
jgi:hypothetical protein